MALTYRSVKGSKLTAAEIDANTAAIATAQAAAVAAQSTASTAQGSATTALAQLRNKNKARNNNFSVNQRAVSGSVVLAAGVYGHDGWGGGASGCTYTFATSANVTTVTISAGSLKQQIDGAFLQSGPVTLSWPGTALGKIGGGAYAASPITGTAVGGANLAIEFGTGTLGLVQLEEGSTPTTCVLRDPEDEDRLNKWYLRRIIINNGAVAGPIGQAQGATAGNMWLEGRMRVIPTSVTYTGPITLYDGSAAGAISSFNAAYDNGTGYIMQFICSSALTVGRATFFYANGGNCTLTISSEIAL